MWNNEIQLSIIGANLQNNAKIKHPVVIDHTEQVSTWEAVIGELPQV